MIIVVDECLGLYERPVFLDENISYVIHPFTTGDKAESFLKQVERAKPSNLRPTLKFKMKTCRDELNFFAETILAIKPCWDGLDKVPLFYFYSPLYTNYEQVKMIQNIFLPEVRVFPISIKSNRAKALFLMHKLQQDVKQTRVYADCVDYYYYLLNLDHKLSSYILSPKPLFQFKPKKWRYVYKPKEGQNVSQLVQIHRDGQLHLIELGSVENLWNQILALKRETEELWAVTSGVPLPQESLMVSDEEKAYSSIHLYDIKQPTIPVNIPFIDISIYTGNREEDRAVVQG